MKQLVFSAEEVTVLAKPLYGRLAIGDTADYQSAQVRPENLSPNIDKSLA